jgi:hypothetical protein
MLKHRIAKLEAATPKPVEDLQIGRFFVSPGNLTPPGYECEGVATCRRDDESEALFKQRCFESVHWKNGFDRKLFYPAAL